MGGDLKPSYGAHAFNFLKLFVNDRELIDNP